MPHLQTTLLQWAYKCVTQAELGAATVPYTSEYQELQADLTA